MHFFPLQGLTIGLSTNRATWNNNNRGRASLIFPVTPSQGRETPCDNADGDGNEAGRKYGVCVSVCVCDHGL